MIKKIIPIFIILIAMTVVPSIIESCTSCENAGKDEKVVDRDADSPQKKKHRRRKHKKDDNETWEKRNNNGTRSSAYYGYDDDEDEDFNDYTE